ncbi:uncharacterized protein LOC106050729 isoform X2 [Biomphalaria glabrata]|nr:uncharacterized protein LOC106050729 isoform X2 [Biomphalaria glabrata]XP_055867202.1 uncharacterized protein LOC106050729 isoform X2 [Biomphalaria glabrata]XP_055867204.1 uncharacterized protein LOC106050729 isoform X2 [Biomphalaria glabrata]
MNRMRIFNYAALLHIAALLIDVNDGIKEDIFVNLQEFNQKDSITNCTHGLLAQIDRLGLKAFLQYTGANDYAKTVVEIVSIEMKDSKSRVYSVLQEISFSRCLQRTSYFVRCEKITDNKYQISIQMLAKALMNKAILLIAISNGTHRIQSNIINLPTVFDPFNVALYVNGKKLSPTECLIDLSHTKQITFCCDLNAPSATMATIYHNGAAVAESERCAAHFAETNANDDSMSFLCSYCNARTENITCRLIFGHTAMEKITENKGAGHTVEEDINTIVILVAVQIVVIVLVIIFITFLAIYLRRKKFRSLQKSTFQLDVDAESTEMEEPLQYSGQNFHETTPVAQTIRQNIQDQDNAEPDEQFLLYRNSQRGTGRRHSLPTVRFTTQLMVNN